VSDVLQSEFGALSIAKWCRAKGISTASFFKLKRIGLTPAELHIPGTNIKRITAEADREWAARMLELTKTKEYEREAERRRAIASKAGKIAGQSPLHVSKRGPRATAATPAQSTQTP